MSNKKLQKYTMGDYKEIFSDLDFLTEPMYHQYVSLLWSADKHRIVYLQGIGTGKTLTSIFTHHLWDTNRVLVICPNSIIRTWEEELDKHTDKKVIILKGTKEKRLKLMKQEADYYVTNYEGLRSLFAKKVKVNGKGKKKYKFVPSYKALRNFRCDGITFDEVHKLGDKDSLQTEISGHLSAVATNVIGLTGTMYDLQKAWSIYNCIDRGKTLGKNYYKYLNSYFKKINFDWVLRHNAYKRIAKRIEPSTLRYRRDECIDLPRVQRPAPIMIEKTKEQKKIELDLVQGHNIKDFEMGDVFSPGHKIRQISGGFVYNDKKEVLKIKNNKEKELREILKNIDDKVIIFHQYVPEAHIIEDVCKSLKYKFAAMRAETDNEKAYQAFKTNPKCKVLIAHPLSAGEGLNFQDVCSTIVYYSSDGSQKTRDQTEGRVIRNNQKKSCLIIDLIVEDSSDVVSLTARKRKKDFQKCLYNYIENLQQEK